MTSGHVLSFLRRASYSNDWSQQELAEFYRVEAALLQGGLSLTTDRGISDEGDPWFVFCRADNDEVIAHFARIDREYVIISSLHSGVARGSDFRSLIRRMIESHPLMLPIRRTQGQKIYLHPAALLTAMLASAYFLTSEKESAGANPSSDHAKNTSITSLLAQKLAVLSAAGLMAIWFEHQAESVFKSLENTIAGIASPDDKGGAQVAEMAHDAFAALDTSVMRAIRDIELGAHRTDLSSANLAVPEEGNETNVASKLIVQASAHLVSGADDGSANLANPSLPANSDHVAPAHLDVAQGDNDSAFVPNNYVQPIMPAREVTALLASNQATIPPQSSSSGGSIAATSEAVVQLAVSNTSSSSIQPVVLTDSATPLNAALQQVFVQAGVDTDSVHSQSVVDAAAISSSGISSSPVASSSNTTITSTPSETTASALSEAQILHIVEEFLQNTPSFEIAVAGSNVVIVDKNTADASSPQFGVLTWDLSSGATLSIVGIIPHHHHHAAGTAA
jgi:hypothetical protein